MKKWENNMYSLVCRQKRLWNYKYLVFWNKQMYLEEKNGKQWALPACVYHMVRAVYPDIAVEEERTDIPHTELAAIE